VDPDGARAESGSRIGLAGGVDLVKILSAFLLTLTVVCLPASPLLAQTRPDFTGMWEEDASQRKSPYENTAAAGGSKAIARPMEPVKLTQTPGQLTIERTFMDQVTRMTYTFDGKENVNRTGAQIHTTRSRWEGGRFITEGSIFQVTSQGETSWKLTEVRWMTPQGEMAVEVRRVDEDGKAGTVHRVFRKKK
jgi:hypothetical protein